MIRSDSFRNINRQFRLICGKEATGKLNTYRCEVEATDGSGGIPYGVVHPGLEKKPDLRGRRHLFDSYLNSVISYFEKLNEENQDHHRKSNNRTTIEAIKKTLQGLIAGQTLSVYVDVTEIQTLRFDGEWNIQCSYEITRLETTPIKSREKEIDDVKNERDALRKETDLEAEIELLRREIETEITQNWRYKVEYLNQQLKRKNSEIREKERKIGKLEEELQQRLTPDDTQGTGEQADIPPEIVEPEIQEKVVAPIEDEQETKATTEDDDAIEDEKIGSLENQLKEKTAEIEKLNWQFRLFYLLNKQLQEKRQQEKTVEQLKMMKWKEAELNSLKKEHDRLQNEKEDTEAQLKKIGELHDELNNQLTEKDGEIGELRSKNEMLEEQQQQQIALAIQDDVENFKTRASELHNTLSAKQSDWQDKLDIFTSVLSDIKPGEENNSLSAFSIQRNFRIWEEQLSQINNNGLPKFTSEQFIDEFSTFLKARSQWEQQLQKIEDGLSDLQIDWQEQAKALVSSLDIYKQEKQSMNADGLEAEVQKFLSDVNLQAIAPQQGDRYNPKLHIIHSEHSNPQIPRGRIVEVRQRGLMNETEVLQKAQVIISKG